MRKLNWTRTSLADLDHIDEWLSREASPETAVRMLTAIRDRANFLLDFPRGGPPLAEAGFRTLRIHQTPYLFLYRVMEDAIEILRVYHGRENWADPE